MLKIFVKKEVKEQCKEFDRTGEWPEEIYNKAIEQGYLALEVPEEFGGPGLSRVDVAKTNRRNGKGRCRFCNYCFSLRSWNETGFNCRK